MTETVEIGNEPLTSAEIAAIAHGAEVALSAAALRRIAASHAAVQKLAANGAAVYGVTTGLGAAVDTRVTAQADLQRRVPLARCVGVGRRAAPVEVRAIIATRIARLAVGHSGISPAMTGALVMLLNQRVHPVVPMTGSVGEADLAPLAHVAAVLAGAGEAIIGTETLPGIEALRRAGIAAPDFGVKDGIALLSSNAASVALGALTLDDIGRLLNGLAAAGALSFEGYRANIAPLLPEAIALRPVPGQAWVAARLRHALAGGDLANPGEARRLQDPLSLRCIGPVLGAAKTAYEAADAAITLELRSSDDNPAIIGESGHALPTANFDATHLALAFETLGLALARVAAMCGERIMQMMSPASSGLPRFLTPIQEGRNGFATVQKTVAALVAEIQHRAMPMPAAIIPVADRVEDYGTMALAIVEKTREVAARLELIAGIELMVAGQACDLRQGIRLGQGTAAIHARVRSVVARLHEDRPTGADIEALAALVRKDAFSDAMRQR